MRLITKKFFETSSIEKNSDTIAVMDYLCHPNTVLKMINAINSGMPALSGIVSELEEQFAFSEGFPLHNNAPDKNAKNRRNVGWMVRFVLREFGYAPIDKSDKTRIGSNSGSKYFGNASLYKYDNDKASYKIVGNAFLASKDWTIKDMRMAKEDDDYENQRKRMKELRRRIKKLKLSTLFLTSYLMRTGFNYLLSDADLEMYLRGMFVPCVEITDALENAICTFEMIDECMEERKKK